LSPVLWRKLPGARSAGRVQSVALRLVCDRELEIEKFVPREYWSLIATLATPRGEAFQARLVGADGQKIARLDIGAGAEAEAFKRALEQAAFAVAAVEAKPTKRNPAPPFTTSTLQQEASRKLGFPPAHTMRVAQRLYEGIDIGGETVGLITYMRTDGVQIAEEAITAIRSLIREDYGARYVPDGPRRYQTKAKNAQEAHEAIRPTDVTRRPRDIARFLDSDQAKLYDLIFKRAVTSQMESAELERTTVDITANVAAPKPRVLDLRATGTVVTFDGFLAVYQEGRDEASEDEEGRRLPQMSVNEALEKIAIDASQHFTEPPPRYSEASLVKRLEELGIGRPSTYASILQVLKDRKYVRGEKGRLIPEDRGRIVTAFLESFFSRYVEYDFTADLEEQLDRVSNNEIEWIELMRRFWRDFFAAVDGIKNLKISDVMDALDDMLAPHIFPPRPDGTDPRLCPTCGTGRLSLKLGRYGAFIGCSNYPDCRYTRPFSVPGADGVAEPEARVLGQDPETGLDVSLRSGRFGPYVQLGDSNGEEKPKRAGLPKGTDPETIDLDFALGLLSLPRELGNHPEDGEPIVAGIGRYGAYVQHGKTFANLEAGDDVLTIGLNRAVTLIADKRTKDPRRRKFAADPGRSLGEHPDRGGPIVVKSGRYGPYVSHDGLNATIPRDKSPDAITLEEAVGLLAARAERVGNAPPRRRSGAGGRKAAEAGTAADATGAAGAEAAAATNGGATEAAGDGAAGPKRRKAAKPSPAKRAKRSSAASE
jgi:DNA topoisomerase-1